MAWHEGYPTDPTLVEALTPAERQQAVHDLLAAVRAGRYDGRAVQGLGYLRCAEALPLLHQLLHREDFISQTPQAIAAIDPASLDQTIIVELLTPGIH